MNQTPSKWAFRFSGVAAGKTAGIAITRFPPSPGHPDATCAGRSTDVDSLRIKVAASITTNKKATRGICSLAGDSIDDAIRRRPAATVADQHIAQTLIGASNAFLRIGGD